MMKLFKRAAMLVLALVMLCSATVAQAQDMSLNLQKVMVNDQAQLQVVLNTNVDKELAPADFELLLDTTPLTVDSVKPYDQGTSWVVLIDVSTVAVGDPVKAFLNSVIDYVVTTGGNMDIVTTKDASVSLSTDLAALRAKADAARQDKNATELNQAVTDVLNYLETNNSVKARTCLVVISDGRHNDKDQTVTSAIAQEKIAGSATTVYAVSYRYEPEAIFSALAQRSVGGVAFRLPYAGNLDKSKSNAAEAMSNYISPNESQFYLLTSTPGQTGQTVSVKLMSENASVSRTADLTHEQQNALQVSIDVNATPAPTAAPTAVPTVEPTATPFPGPVEPITWTMVYVGAGALALILVIVIVAVVAKKKKAAQVDEVPESANPGEASAADAADQAVEAFEPTMPNAVPQRSTVRVTLSQVGAGAQKVYTADMQDNMIVGRNPAKANLVVAAEDHKVSGAHLCLRYVGGVMTVEDMSLNGTRLNGVQLTKNVPAVIHENDRLTLGESTTLLITWHNY